MNKIIFTILIWTGSLFLYSCQKELSCENCADNKPPIANAGADQIIILPNDSIHLDGSASTDPEGNVIKYEWTKVGGPLSFKIKQLDSSRTKVTTLSAGIYIFELKVTDDKGSNAKDSVLITVNAAARNQAPIANSGVDQVITLPDNTATLNGSTSFDPDGSIVNFTWSKITGPAQFILNNPQQAITTLKNLVEGLYSFRLSVTDNNGITADDTIYIQVNQPPPFGTGDASVWFWTRDTVWNNIYIKINNEIKILNESWGGNGDPSCYPYGGSMDFDLPAGQYPYKTWRHGRDTISGTAMVFAGICNSIQIKY
jgi:hypothetical protein